MSPDKGSNTLLCSRGECSQLWQITAGLEVPGLTTDSKAWWDRWGPLGYINLNLNVDWISTKLFSSSWCGFPFSVLHSLQGDTPKNKKTADEIWDVQQHCIKPWLQRMQHFCNRLSSRDSCWAISPKKTKTKKPFKMYLFNLTRCRLILIKSLKTRHPNLQTQGIQQGKHSDAMLMASRVGSVFYMSDQSSSTRGGG